MRPARVLFVFTGLLLLFLGSISLFAQDSDQMTYAGLKEAKFANVPFFPNCATVATQHGDPSQGAATLVGKLSEGCNIAWHWHSYAENVVLVSGSGKVEMKDGPAHVLSAGDYAHIPAKHTHQFTCVADCTLYVMPEGKFDIHYVDKDGKEIPLEEALKNSAKKPAM